MKRLHQDFVNGCLILSIILISASTSALTLSWDPVINDDILSYKVYWGQESGHYTHSVYVGNKTQYHINLKDSVVYYITVTAIDFWGNESEYGSELKLIGNVSNPVERQKTRLQIFPNPARNAIRIQFTVDRRQTVKISVYNVLGQNVATLTDQSYERGSHIVQWNKTSSTGLSASGVYYCLIQKETLDQVRKITFTR